MYDLDFEPIEPPPPEERLSLFEEATREAHQHKWIESEKSGRDLGDAAIRDWHKRHWRDFCRERWIEHLQGEAFWVELDNDDYALLTRRFHHNGDLVAHIVDHLEMGGENLDVIQWAMDNEQSQNDVLEILGILDINSHRIAPATSIDEEEFIRGIRARHHPRVLIVDDDDDTRMILAELFREESMEVVAVSTGEAALEEVQSRRFDLFLIDILLPGKHGAEIAWYLHRHGLHCPIIAISGALESWHPDDLTDCGFTRLIAKPFDLDAMRTLGRDVVNYVNGDSKD